jgi:hypothetical protein
MSRQLMEKQSVAFNADKDSKDSSGLSHMDGPI